VARARWRRGPRKTDWDEVRAFCLAEFQRRFGERWTRALERDLMRDKELDAIRRKVLAAHRDLVRASERAAGVLAALSRAGLSDEDASAVFLDDLESQVTELRRLGLIGLERPSRAMVAKSRGRLAARILERLKRARTARDFAIVSLLLGNRPGGMLPQRATIAEVVAREADAMGKAMTRASRH